MCVALQAHYGHLKPTVYNIKRIGEMRSAYKELQKSPAGMPAVRAHNLRVTEHRKLNSCLNLNSLHNNLELKDLNTSQMTMLFEYCKTAALDDKNFLFNEKAMTWGWKDSAKKDLTIPTNVREFTDLAMIIRLREKLKMAIHEMCEKGNYDAVSELSHSLHDFDDFHLAIIYLL